MAKEIPLGKITVDDKDVIAASKSVDGLGKSIDGLGNKATPALTKTTTGATRLTDRLGKLSSFGRDLRQAGGFLGNDTIAAIGNVADGFGDVAQSIDAIIKQKGSLGKVLGTLGAVVGGIGIGTQIYDATIGKLQGGNTAGNILSQTGQFIGAGFNQDQLRKNMQFELSMMRVAAENVTISANNTVFDFKQGLQKNPEAVNNAISSILGTVGSALGGSGLAGAYTNRLSRGAQYVANDQNSKAQSDAIAKAIADYTQRAYGMNQALGGMQAAGKTFEYQKSSVQFNYQNALNALAKEITTKQIAIVQQYNADTLKLDQQYYAQRAELARNYGLEAQRAEEDHQRNVARLTKDHNKRMSKLADQRDALGLEDEMSAYQDQRQQADDDYEVQARRRSEDYANQLRELEQAHQEQERERREAYNQELADLKVYAQNKRNQEAVEYGKLLKDIVQAFVDARNAFAAQMTTNTSTTNQTATVNQVINGGQGTYTPDLIKSSTYAAIIEVFKGSK